MGIELTVASMPNRGYVSGSTDRTTASTTCTTIALGGVLDDASIEGILAAVREAHERTEDSILIEMNDVRMHDPFDGEAFAARIMELRAAGTHVQCSTSSRPLHDRLRAFAYSRDWLLDFSDVVPGPRRAVHTDGPGNTTS